MNFPVQSVPVDLNQSLFLVVGLVVGVHGALNAVVAVAIVVGQRKHLQAVCAGHRRALLIRRGWPRTAATIDGVRGSQRWSRHLLVLCCLVSLGTGICLLFLVVFSAEGVGQTLIYALLSSLFARLVLGLGATGGA